jgi:glycosyltransferase involved in cell wall biosynthesis
MIHLFLNGGAANAGGGLTYLRNVVPHLSAKPGVQATILVSVSLRLELSNLPKVLFLEVEKQTSARRLWWEQTALPGFIQDSGAQVLVSAGNIALRRAPVPQILLSRNSLYTSSDFYRDLRARRDYALWCDTWVKGLLVRRSLHWADCVVAPSRAFAENLRHWAGVDVIAIPHGFDPDVFSRDKTPLPDHLHKKLNGSQDVLRLLFVSHYNYYRNFETLLRALPLLREKLKGRKIQLYLTCRLRNEENPGKYRTESVSALVNHLDIADSVVQLGAVPYQSLHHVYRACDMYVAHAYAESFGHPLVEAMASGLAVLASDIPVHHEICGEAARYFSRFSAEELATQIASVANSPEASHAMVESGRKRAGDFSWSRHVDELLALAHGLVGAKI